MIKEMNKKPSVGGLEPLTPHVRVRVTYSTPREYMWERMYITCN